MLKSVIVGLDNTKAANQAQVFPYRLLRIRSTGNHLIASRAAETSAGEDA
jgi:hypothetical protein